MTQYTGYIGTRLFITALKKIEPSYSNIRSNQLKENSTLNVIQEIRYY